jgi:integrase
VRAHLPAYARPAATFAYITGWRLKSEILPLQWRQVDFRAGIVRLDVGTTKNNDGRTFPMTPELLATLEAQRVATNAPSAQNRQHHPVGVPLDEAGPTA